MMHVTEQPLPPSDPRATAKIAIVDDRQTYSQGLADETRKALNAGGVKETLDDTITPGEKDYSALVAKLKQAGIDVLYYAGYPVEAGSIVRQMKAQGLSTVMVSGDAVVNGTTILPGSVGKNRHLLKRTVA